MPQHGADLLRALHILLMAKLVARAANDGEPVAELLNELVELKEVTGGRASGCCRVDDEQDLALGLSQLQDAAFEQRQAEILGVDRVVDRAGALAR